MENWRLLKRAIPDGHCQAVAGRVHRNVNQVLRWRRRPLSDDEPLATGQRSPLDWIFNLIDAVFLVNQIGAALIAEAVWSHYCKLRDAQNPKTEWDRRHHAAIALHEAVEAVNCLNLDAPDEQTIIEVVEARDALDQCLVNLRRGQLKSNERPALREVPEPAVDRGTRAGSGGRRHG